MVYEPTAFNGEEVSRVNLVMRASDDANNALCDLDSHIIELATESSLRLFGKVLTRIEVEGRYNSSVKISDKGYKPTFRAKINIVGRNKVRC